MTIPTGAPVWSRTNDHATYGGDLNKKNYQSRGAVNPLTDVTAKQFTRLAADVAAMGRTVEFATITYHDVTATGTVVLDAYDGMAGAVPTLFYAGPGHVTITWAASYTDDYGVAADIDLRHAGQSVHSASMTVATTVLSDTDVNGKNEVANVYVWDSAGVALGNSKVTLTVSTS